MHRTLTLTALCLSAATAPLAVSAQTPGVAPAAMAAPAPIQRDAAGHPNLNGYWSANPARPAPPPGQLPAAGQIISSGLAASAKTDDPNDLAAIGNYRNGDITNLTNDGVPLRRRGDNLPVYKPKYWERVLDLDLNGNQEDSYNHCFPMGIPRMGGPSRIVQTPTDLHLFYGVAFQHNQYRSVPYGPRKFPVDRDGSWLGDPVATWDGDTLVIETVGFNDQTWIGPQGYFHGYELSINERFKVVDNNRITYDVTVTDPDYLERPWVLDTRTLYRNTTPNYRMEEAAPCSERDNEHLVGKQREM